MKNTIIFILTLFSAFIVSEAQQRNVLLIIADDVGVDSLPFSNNDPSASQPPIPNIQSLADSGVIFDQAYAQPTCSPTRSSILTGNFGWRTGIYSPLSNKLSADEYTLPEIIRDENTGYATGSFGKWHLGNQSTSPNDIGGWEHFSGSLEGGLSDYRRWTKYENGVAENLTASYATRENVTDAIEWINNQSDDWFAWIGFNAAHTPLHAPPSNLHSYDLSGLTTTNNPRPFYEAMIEAMDNQIGRLISSIDTNNTTIIFLGDNGTYDSVIQPPYDIAGRAKGSLYEGGTHVPFFITGAGVIDGGRTNSNVIHCADIFATILELTGTPKPAHAGYDSRSLIPLLNNESFSPSEECILMESDQLSSSGAISRAIRDDTYKLIRIDGRADKLYNMSIDPLESTNLLRNDNTNAVDSAAYIKFVAKLDLWSPLPVEIPTNGYPIVDSGQLECYDDQGGYTTLPPSPGSSFAGQDAQYNGLQPAYHNNADGTITDLNTGLMWQQSPDLANKATFAEATNSVATFNLAGYTDWRLPSIKELYSLIDFSGSTGTSEFDAIPYINTNYFDFAFGDTSVERYIDAQYWSATEYIGTTMFGDPTVFGVNFADGRIKGYPRVMSGGREPTSFVRYVRGNTEYGINDFEDMDNGTVIDHATGLMWQKSDSDFGYNWEQALAYAESLQLAGYRDWRLPNAKELQSIVDYTKAPQVTGSAAINTEYFDVTATEAFYWTSTTHLDGAPESIGNYAVYLSFGRAFGWMPDPPGQTTTYALLDVHGAGAQRSDPKSGTPILTAPGHGPQGDILRIYNMIRCVREAATEPQNDSDNDGLTDWYEYNYSGSATGLSPTGDNDSDNTTNIDEMNAGTIPTERDSLFRITKIDQAPQNTQILWSSELGKTYNLCISTNLITDPFDSTVIYNIPATPPINYFTDQENGDTRFYKVQTN